MVVASQKVVSSLPGANTAIGRRIAEITSAGMNTFLRLGDLQIVKGDLGGWSMRPRGDFTRVEVAPASVKKCLNTALQNAVGN